MQEPTGMIEIAEKPTDFDTEIKNLHIALKSAAESLLRHLLCEFDGDRFGLFKSINSKADKLTKQAGKIKNKTERASALERLEKFRRESGALVITLWGLVQQAEIPRSRYQKLLATIKEL